MIGGFSRGSGWWRGCDAKAFMRVRRKKGVMECVEKKGARVVGCARSLPSWDVTVF